VNRPRFFDFRTRVAAYAQSIGSPLGVCIGNIPALAGLVNAATERLLFDPMQPDEGWWGTWAKYRFNISRGQPYLTCPRGVSRVIVMDVDRSPTPVQNGFYEFLDFGRGLVSPHEPVRGDAWDRGGQKFLETYDRDSVPTLGQLASTPQYIQVHPFDARDVGKTFIVQGADQNGMTVYGTDPVTNQEVLGEFITMAQPFVLSKNQYTSITGMQKDVTFAPVTIMQQNAASGAALDLSMMEPSETSASYRAYMVGGLPGWGHNCSAAASPVTAQCKLEFVPVTSDPDYLGIPNVPALFAECEAIRLSSMDNAKSMTIADQKHKQALSLLFGQLDHMLGKDKPAIIVPIFGSDRLQTQRL